jgi:hypothetical protein
MDRRSVISDLLGIKVHMARPGFTWAGLTELLLPTIRFSLGPGSRIYLGLSITDAHAFAQARSIDLSLGGIWKALVSLSSGDFRQIPTSFAVELQPGHCLLVPFGYIIAEVSVEVSLAMNQCVFTEEHLAQMQDRVYEQEQS